MSLTGSSIKAKRKTNSIIKIKSLIPLKFQVIWLTYIVDHRWYRLIPTKYLIRIILYIYSAKY